MKNEFVFEVFEKIESNKYLKRKLKLFLAFGIVGIFICSAVAVWIGFGVFNYAATKIKDVGTTPIVQDYVPNMDKELKTLLTNEVVGCWSKAQSLIAIQVWIERSVADNLKDLRNACMGNNLSHPQDLNIPKKPGHNL